MTDSSVRRRRQAEKAGKSPERTESPSGKKERRAQKDGSSWKFYFAGGATVILVIFLGIFVRRRMEKPTESMDTLIGGKLAGRWRIEYTPAARCPPVEYTIDAEGYLEATASGIDSKYSRLHFKKSNAVRLRGVFPAKSQEEVIAKSTDGRLIVQRFEKGKKELICQGIGTLVESFTDIMGAAWASVHLSDSRAGASNVTLTVTMKPRISVPGNPLLILVAEDFGAWGELRPGAGPADLHLADGAHITGPKTGKRVTISAANRNFQQFSEYSFAITNEHNPQTAGKYAVTVRIGFLFCNVEVDIVDEVHKRIVAIGDLHGDLETTRRILQWRGLTDADDHWIGGTTTLVQVGDVIDRGPFSYETLELLHKLKEEAPAQGGHVELLLGNHELMWLHGDTRYLHPADRLHQEPVPTEVAGPRRAKGKAGGDGEEGSGMAGKWIMSSNIVYVAQETVFVHGGITPDFAKLGADGLNAEFHRAIRADPMAPILNPPGPLWTRRYTSAGGHHCDELKEVLDMLGAKRMVVGHTPQWQTLRPGVKCDHSLYAVDVAMSEWMSKSNRDKAVAVFEVVDGQADVHWTLLKELEKGERTEL
eukprot:237102_1